MKRIIVLLSAITLLLCINACEPQNKGHFEKGIPKCLKQTIKEVCEITSVEEYCNENGTKKIYHILDNMAKGEIRTSLLMCDENCSNFIAWGEENPPRPLNPNDSIWNAMDFSYLLQDGTIEHKGEIYHFKRIVFTQKNK